MISNEYLETILENTIKEMVRINIKGDHEGYCVCNYCEVQTPVDYNLMDIGDMLSILAHAEDCLLHRAKRLLDLL